MNVFEVMILGIIEGFTELLPISSTAHLILASSFLQIPESDFLTSFHIAIQLGALLAIGIGFIPKKEYIIKWWKHIIIASVPAGIVGFFGYTLIRNFLQSTTLLLWGVGLGGIIIIASEYFFKRNKKYILSTESVQSLENFSMTQAFFIGCFQIIAFFPGVSRSASTVFGGLWLGLSRTHALEFSFLLAVPIMISATGYDLLRQSYNFSQNEWVLLGIGCMISAGVAYLAIRLLRVFITRYTFSFFGWYRVVLTLVLIAILFF